MMFSNTKIQKRLLGQTELEVSPIGLGVMQFSGDGGLYSMMFPTLTQEKKNAIIQTAIDGGINWFDTAEMYGRGNSERSLAHALKVAGKKDGEIIIGTKWFPILRTANNIPKSIKDRLHFLDGYTIDLYMVHQPWGFSSPEEEMDAMADLVEEGKIRCVGVSNFNVDQMQRAHAALQKRGLPLAVNQVQYNLMHRNIEINGVLDAAKDLGVTIVAWGPLGSGALSGKFHRDPNILNRTPYFRRMRMRRQLEQSLPLVNALEKIATNHDVTAAQVALNWLIHFHGETVVAIPGASDIQQAAQNAGAMHFRLSEDEMVHLDEISQKHYMRRV